MQSKKNRKRSLTSPGAITRFLTATSDAFSSTTVAPQPQSDRTVLQTNLQALGMAIRLDPPGDGSCFFHSVIDQCHRVGIDAYPGGSLKDQAFKLRTAAVKFVDELVSDDLLYNINYPLFRYSARIL